MYRLLTMDSDTFIIALVEESFKSLFLHLVFPSPNLKKGFSTKNDVRARKLLNLNEWRKIGKYCDVTLVIGKRKFPVHKNVLAAAIEYFDVLFDGNFAEKGKDVIELNDVDPDGFQLLLDYVYGGKVHVNDYNLKKLLVVATFYRVEHLLKELLEYAKSKILVENSFEFYILADNIGFYELKHFLKTIINQNLLVASRSSHTFLDITYSMMLEVIDSWLKREENRFYIIISWVEHRLAERSDYLPELMKHICFACICNNAIINNILNHKLIVNNLNIIKTIIESKQKHLTKTAENALVVYSIKRSQLIRIDIVDQEVERIHWMVNTNADFDDFQMVSVADKIYFATFKSDRGNELYSFENSQWFFLNRISMSNNKPISSMVYSNKFNSIYVTNRSEILMYNLNKKTSTLLDTFNGRPSQYSSTLVHCNGLIYTNVPVYRGFDIVVYDQQVLDHINYHLERSPPFNSVVAATLNYKIYFVTVDSVFTYNTIEHTCDAVRTYDNKNCSFHSVFPHGEQLYVIRRQWDLIDTYDTKKKIWTGQIKLPLDEW